MVNLTDSGRCVFRMYMPHAGSVELLGTFCGWKAEREEGAIELEHEGDGWWIARLDLPEGDHEFCYLVDGRTWMPDYAAGGVRRNSTGSGSACSPSRHFHEMDARPIGSGAEPRIGRSNAREDERAYAQAS